MAAASSVSVLVLGLGLDDDAVDQAGEVEADQFLDDVGQHPDPVGGEKAGDAGGELGELVPTQVLQHRVGEDDVDRAFGQGVEAGDVEHGDAVDGGVAVAQQGLEVVRRIKQ